MTSAVKKKKKKSVTSLRQPIMAKSTRISTYDEPPNTFRSKKCNVSLSLAYRIKRKRCAFTLEMRALR